VLLSSTWDSTAKVLTLTWDQTVTYEGGSSGYVIFTDSSGSVWENDSIAGGVPTGVGATMVFVLVASVLTAGTVGTVTVAAGSVENGTAQPNALTRNFATTTYGGAASTAGVPTIGTYDEYVNVYSANSNQLAAGASQDQIHGAIDAANLAAVRFCGIAFTNSGNTQQTFTELCDGDGSNTIRVRNLPVVSVTSITVTDSDGNTDVLDTDTYDCQLTTGTIKRTIPGTSVYIYDRDAEIAPFPQVGGTSFFPVGFQNISVVYVAGYTTAPADLRWAIYEAVDEILSRVGIRGTKNMPSESDLRDAVIRRLRPFERIVM